MAVALIKDQIKNIPKSPGIYLFYDKNKSLLYVGKSVSIQKRVRSYFSNKKLGPKTNMLVKQIEKIDFIKVFSEFEALLLESELIRKNKPFFNIQSKDDKSPLYIEITNDKVHQITVVRNPNVTGNNFIKGPFQSSKVTKDVLRIIRRIFPYCHHKNPKKPCLYVHLGLCPYPYGSEEARTDYLKTIKKIKKLLNGEINSLTRELTKEMIQNSKKQNYEKASKIKKQIEKLQSLTTSYHAPSEFLENPSLVDDLAIIRLEDIKRTLKLKKTPKRIECYDIANISGKLATGSMVVFINGKPSKENYRRFKIKFSSKPNDYEMTKEVLIRRFRNNWPKPDLLIVDGGKGQLSVAVSAVGKSNNLKIISLAKRFEQIHTQDLDSPIKLEKESPSRQLVQQLRDEAHRFANTYHKLLRSKNMISA